MTTKFDITTAPLDELYRDMKDSAADIVICETALLTGIETYSGGSVQDRIDVNRKIIDAIKIEIRRRADLQWGL